MISRRDFLSRFFKGVAVAAITPSVIAQVCEEYSIPKGTVFSFPRPSTADGYQITIDTLTYITGKTSEQKFYDLGEIENRWAANLSYSIGDVEKALQTNNWDLIEAKHAASRKDPIGDITAAINRVTGKMPDRMIIPLNANDSITIAGIEYPIEKFKAECVHRIAI